MPMPPRPMTRYQPNAELHYHGPQVVKMSVKKTKSKKQIVLPNECIACKKIPVVAKKVTDFWVGYCEDHKNQSIQLTKDNMHKVGRYVDA